MSAIEWFLNIPRRLVFLIVVVLIAAPIIAPFALPVPVTNYTKQYADIIDNLPPRSVVLVGIDTSARDLELWPASVLSFKRFLARDSILIIHNFNEQGALMTKFVLDESGWRTKTYGTDYVRLGFVPGTEAALAALVLDFTKVRPYDQYGAPTASMPIFQTVKDINDVDLLSIYSHGAPGHSAWRVVVVVPYNKQAILSVAGSTMVGVYDEFALGIWKGVLAAQRGVVEYEAYEKAPGFATATYAPSFLAAAVLVTLVIVTNIIDYAMRMGVGRKP